AREVAESFVGREIKVLIEGEATARQLQTANVSSWEHGLIRETKFERLGVFSYSREDGTLAGKMAGQLGDKVKQKRRELAMAAQHRVAREVAESFVGREIKVLIEGEATARQLQTANVSSWEHGLIRETDTALPQLKGRYLVARGEADAPDIDGRVYVRGKLPVGQFARVKIIGHTDYDLIASAIS
ncbi:MAG TPA: hypothetical protein VL527_18280, partial [Dongiaceae bacterium]|nr:hypothetical protein [Dongiaceae bacterium]